MKVKMENSGPCRKTLTVELPTETVAAEYKEIKKRFAKAAAIPGYRKGKAPAMLVERHYAKAIMEDLRDSLISGSYHEAFKEEKLKPVAVLDVDTVSVGKDIPMQYKVVLDVQPEFKLPKYNKISIKPKKTEVTDEQVQEELNSILERFAEYFPIEDKPIEKGFLAQIDYDLISDDFIIDKLDTPDAMFLKGRNTWVATGQNSLLPGLGDVIVGMKKKETKEVEISFPSDFRREAFAGKTLMYRIELKDAREKRLPKIDADFLLKIQVDSEEAFRLKLKEMLVAKADRNEKERLKNEVCADLLKNASFDLPESLVIEETRNLFSSMIKKCFQNGMSKNEVEEKKKELFDMASKSASDKVRLGYVLDRISEEEKIELTDSDVDTVINELAVYNGVAPEALRADLEEKKKMSSLRDELLANKTLDFILENASTEGDGAGFFARLMKGKKEEV